MPDKREFRPAVQPDSKQIGPFSRAGWGTRETQKKSETRVKEPDSKQIGPFRARRYGLSAGRELAAGL